MKSVEEQFEELTKDENDPSGIRRLIGKTEDLYLECKTIDQKEIEDNLIINRQSVAYFNLGKAISAFANAEGGLVVWGLFAKEQNKSSPDLIQEERPILNVTKVKTDFDSITGKVVSRRVVGIKNAVIYTDKQNDEGFIVTYIPKSDEAPHRVEGERSGSRRYYRRHGNGSYEMEHYELEELFGGRTSPKIKFVITSFPKATINKKIKKYGINFGLKNVGKAVARYPFLEIIKFCKLRKSDFGIDGNRNTGLPLVAGRDNKYQGGISNVIHIDDILWIDQFEIDVDTDFNLKEKLCQIQVKIACDGFRMRELNKEVNLGDVVETSNIIEFDYDE